MLTHIQDGSKPRDVWDFKAGIDLAEIGKMHAIFETLSLSVDRLKNMPDSNNKAALLDLSRIYALYFIQECGSTILESESLNPEHFEIINEVYESLLDSVEKNALALVHALDISDFQHASPIAFSNGQPYENLYKWAKENAMMNQFDVFPDMVNVYRKFYNDKKSQNAKL